MNINIKTTNMMKNKRKENETHGNFSFIFFKFNISVTIKKSLNNIIKSKIGNLKFIKELPEM